MRQTFIRVNDRIRVPRVRCINANGDMVGIVPTPQARTMAREQGLDLVEISPNADPPVCRIMDFGKFMYEQKRKEKESRRHQAATALKEVKFHANVADHDYQTKVNQIRSFVAKGHKVKSSLFFRGRENAHRELGFELMSKVVKDCSDVCTTDMAPKLMGNQIVMIMGPKATRG